MSSSREISVHRILSFAALGCSSQRLSISKDFYHLITIEDEFDENQEAADLCPVNIIRVEKT